MFNKYYQDELTYLRDLGKEYAAKYPAFAPMLADRGGDPDVERLLEGVAFLTGRIRQKLDDELPELIVSLASLLFPQLTRPLPGAAILEITPAGGVMRERRLLKAGSEVESVPINGTPCRFSTIVDCDVIPWTVTDVRLEALPGRRQQLRVEIQVIAGIDLAQVVPEKLSLHLAGEPRMSLQLLLWLNQHTEDVVLIDPELGASQENEISLGRGALKPFGFEDDQSLLPLCGHVFPGYRLLAEYYALPAKFAFVEVEGVTRAKELGKDIKRFVLAFRFDSPLPGGPELPRDAVKIHCVPVVNVFRSSSEPIRLDPERERFLVRPAGLTADHGEVYAITKVEAVRRGALERRELPNFLEFSHASLLAEGERAFYSQHLEPSVMHDGADVSISVGTAENQKMTYDAEVLSVELLATNRRLANEVRAGELRNTTPTAPSYATFRNLSAVTTYVPPPLGLDLQWRVVAHAAAGLRSLTEPDVLRSVLSVYNLHASVDRQAARANDLRIAAVKDVRVTPAERLYHGAPIRGVALDIDLDEGGFAGEGDMHLFGAILDRLFADYVSLNSFSVTNIHGIQSRVLFTWPARSGNLTML